jgi:hypothetical protein
MHRDSNDENFDNINFIRLRLGACLMEFDEKIRHFLSAGTSAIRRLNPVSADDLAEVDSRAY